MSAPSKRVPLASDIEAMSNIYSGVWNSYKEVHLYEEVASINQRWPLLLETRTNRESIIHLMQLKETEQSMVVLP